MNILVTGGSGFIGSHVIDVLVEAGHSVTNLDLRPPHRSDIVHRTGSIVERSVVDEEVAKADAVYHIGGFSDIDLVRNHPIETIELNVLSTTYLLDACRKFKTRQFLYASSVYAYDRSGHLYTTSKAASERIIEDYGTLFGVPYTILRYATVYGPRNRASDVVYLFVRGAKHDGCIEIHGDGMQKRNFTHVRDAAEGSAIAIGNKNCPNATVTIASEEGLTINELAERVKEIVNPQCRVMRRASSRCLDYRGELNGIGEGYQRLGWKPRIGIEEGIKEMKDLV